MKLKHPLPPMQTPRAQEVKYSTDLVLDPTWRQMTSAD